jgi:hypothetical protein
MKFKYSQVKEGIDFLRSEAGLHDIPNQEITLTMREENPGEGVIGECLVISTTVIKKPNQYEDYKKGEITTDYTLEVFASNENRPSRWTATETRNLEK